MKHVGSQRLAALLLVVFSGVLSGQSSSAMSRQATSGLTGAMQACDVLIDDFPNTSYAAAGHFYTGEMQLDRARKRDETATARETFRRIWLLFDPVTYPDLIYRAGARVRNAELDIRAGDLAGAELSYLYTLEGEPMSEWTMRARLGLAGIYLERGEWVLAAETFQQAINEAVSLGYEGTTACKRSATTPMSVVRAMGGIV